MSGQTRSEDSTRNSRIPKARRDGRGARRIRARARASLRHVREQERRFVAKQKLRAVTLADVAGMELPTIARAAAMIEEAGGRIRISDDGTSLVVEIPERVASSPIVDLDQREQLYDCARVISFAKNVVLAELRKNGKKPLSDVLPDEPALP